MNERETRSDLLKAEALRLGFDACGIAPAKPVPLSVQQAYRHWILEHRHATMDYLERNLDKRFDPRLLVDGVKSIVCVALNYYPGRELPANCYQLAWYAYGKDYHDVMKQKLQELLQVLKEKDPALEGRSFCDTAPVLEKYWAQQAGLGWQGKHTQLILPGCGSTYFLGELFLNQEFVYDSPQESRCGTCHACQEHCPAQALYPDPETGLGMLDANLCLSFQTIENRGALSEEATEKLGNSIYGCDSCLKACPYLQFAQPTSHAEFSPSEELLAMTNKQWEQLTPEQYRKLFKGSAVKRAKLEGLRRNILAAGRHKKSST